MTTHTKIEWTDSTWSPIRFRVKADAAAIARAHGYTSLVSIAEKMAGRVGTHCEHVSPGCEHCYAETNNHRCLPGNGTGLPYDRRSRDLVEPFIDEKALLLPLTWKTVLTGIREGEGVLTQKNHKDGTVTITRQRPRRIFVENQSDLFGEWVTDEMLDRVFAVMALCSQHSFQVLTKRPERMLAYLTSGPWGQIEERLEDIATLETNLGRKGLGWPKQLLAPERIPLPNVWLGVSVENQKAADERIPLLLKTPAAIRYLSVEPLLGLVDIDPWIGDGGPPAHGCTCEGENAPCEACDAQGPTQLDWIIAGGESGPGARPFHTEWAQSLVDQCRAANVACFVKQLGSHVITDGIRHRKRDKKGGDMSEWPHVIRVRQFPEVAHA